jgi:hypothetical protein
MERHAGATDAKGESLGLRECECFSWMAMAWAACNHAPQSLLSSSLAQAAGPRDADGILCLSRTHTVEIERIV